MAPCSHLRSFLLQSPESNFNSDSHDVRPGDTLYGNVTFNPDRQSYTIYHSSSDGWSVTNEIPVQQDRSGVYKNYTIFYVVYEKVANCDQYPPDNSVTFTNIRVDYDGVTTSPTWATGVVDEVCSFTAHVVDPKTVSITWDVNGENPPAERVAASQAEARKQYAAAARA